VCQISASQHAYQWQTVVYTAMNLWTLHNKGKFLANGAKSSSSRRTFFSAEEKREIWGKIFGSNNEEVMKE
jgi:hypothetical protein